MQTKEKRRFVVTFEKTILHLRLFENPWPEVKLSKKHNFANVRIFFS